MNFTEALNQKSSLCSRKIESDNKINEVRSELSRSLDSTSYKDVAIFCGGSLGRGDIGKISDLDLFILSNKNPEDEKKVESLELLYNIININKNLGFPQFSNDAQFITPYSFPAMLDKLGSPKDDNDNLFTVRMLLLLESKPIFNNEMYYQFIDRVLDNYFRDSRGKATFKPLFLLNDILRYWRTLCLNYEIIRNNKERPWRKKNINLKFSRMLTIFGTVLPIIVEKETNKEFIRGLVELSPIQRLSFGLDIINDDKMLDEFDVFLENYESFLKMKEGMLDKMRLDDISMDRKSREMASEFSNFLFKVLTHDSINKEYIKYLVV